MTRDRQGRAIIRKGNCSLLVPFRESGLRSHICNNSIRPSSAAMRIVVQRVKSASVTVDGEMVVSSIGAPVSCPGVSSTIPLRRERRSKKLLACKLWENELGVSGDTCETKGVRGAVCCQFTIMALSKKNQPGLQTHSHEKCAG
jgi:hypothetical protein